MMNDFSCVLHSKSGKNSSERVERATAWCRSAVLRICFHVIFYITGVSDVLIIFLHPGNDEVSSVVSNEPDVEYTEVVHPQPLDTVRGKKKQKKKPPLIVDIFFTLLYLFISILKGYIYLSIYYFSDAHRMFFKNLACCWTNFYFGFWCNVFLLTFGCYLTLYPFVCFSPFNPFLGLGGVKPIPAVGERWVGR